MIPFKDYLDLLKMLGKGYYTKKTCQMVAKNGDLPWYNPLKKHQTNKFKITGKWDASWDAAPPSM